MSSELITSSIATAIVGASPLLIAATGELLAERSGVFNVGIEGCMLVGALAGFVAANELGNVAIGLAASMLGGAALALLFAAAVAFLHTNMVVAGLAILFIGAGITGVWGVDYVSASSEGRLQDWHVPILSDIPFVGEAFFSHSPLVYGAFLLPALAAFFLYRTRSGLKLRCVGEDPAAADAMGVSVPLWRIAAVTLGGALAGLGGAALTLDSVGTWLPGVTAGQGWLAIAVVILASWRPYPLIAGALLFGALATIGNIGQAYGWNVPSEFFSALPYVGSLAVLAYIGWSHRHRSGWYAWPASLGEAFVRAR